MGNLKSCRWPKFSPCHCKSKLPSHLRLSAKMPYFNMCEMKQSFGQSVKNLQRSGIFAATVYRLKVGNFKSCQWAKFSPCHCQTKIHGHLKFSAEMPTFNTFEMKQSFRKSVKYRWRCGIFARTVYMLKVGNFKSCRWERFHLAIAKVKHLRTLNIWPKWPVSTFGR